MQLYKLAKFIEDEDSTNCITIQCTIMGDISIHRLESVKQISQPYLLKPTHPRYTDKIHTDLA